jgi:hypothetical protein
MNEEYIQQRKQQIEDETRAQPKEVSKRRQNKVSDTIGEQF